MKHSFLIYLCLVMFVSLRCNHHGKHKVILTGFADKNEVVYETKDANFLFGQKDLIMYCDKKDSNEQNNFSYKQVIQYLKDYQSNSIIIPDTLATELIPEQTPNLNGNVDSLIRARNHKSKYSHVTDAIRWTLLDFAKKGEIKIFDNRTGKFVEFIFLDEVEESWYGETNILLPNDSIIFSQLRWIR